MHPLVEEATRKAAVAWLLPRGVRRAYAVWCVWLDDGLYVVSGPGEQPAPGLVDAATALVTLRGDHGGQIVTWPAEVSRVAPGSQEWASVVPHLTAKRLNAPGTGERMAARWAEQCQVTRLAPVGDPVPARPA